MESNFNLESFQIHSVAGEQELASLTDFFVTEGGFEFLDLVPGLVLEMRKLAQFDVSLATQFGVHSSAVPFPTSVAVYPWRKKIVHLLRPDHFVRIRTSRNEHKLSKGEMDLLQAKRIGIVGLSAGAAVASALVQERIGGELKLADFDVLELSNLNRISDSLMSIGMRKTESLSRKLLELDPFVRLVTYNEGITEANIEAFFLDSGKIDLLVEVCDSLELKVAIRRFARQHAIPVVMETSDRGMIDIERFDLEPNRPIFHGLLNEQRFDEIKEKADRFRYVFNSILEPEHISPRGLYSLSEIGKSIGTWPQLGTDVISGGAHCAMVCREILLGRHLQSGRWYIDVPQILHSSPFMSLKNGTTHG